jgi:hypothetical protein
MAKPDDLTVVAEAIAHYEGVYIDGMSKLKPDGTLWETAKALPGWQAYFYGKFCEIQSIVEYYDHRASRAYGAALKLYLENYNGRSLSEATAKKYAEADTTVLDMRELGNEFKQLSGKIQGLTKGLESLHFQMTNLVALRKAGIEDALF